MPIEIIIPTPHVIENVIDQSNPATTMEQDKSPTSVDSSEDESDDTDDEDHIGNSQESLFRYWDIIFAEKLGACCCKNRQ